MNRMREEENTNMEYALEVRGLTKHYGDFVLDQVFLQVPYGAVVGFIGANGAGKSTTIKAILNLVHKETGDIYLLGHPMEGNEKEDGSNQWKEQLGVIFDECNMPVELTAKEIHHIMNELYRTWEEKKYFAYLSKFQVPTDKKVKDLSKGMKMKLSIAIALSHDSRLLILDEGTSGLDPVVRNEIMDIFREFIEDGGHSVLISSHITSDIEKIADYIVILHQGKVVLEETKDDLLEQYVMIQCTKEQMVKIPTEQIIGKMENAYGAHVLVKNAARWKQEGFVVDHASIEDILLYIVKRDEVR